MMSPRSSSERLDATIYPPSSSDESTDVEAGLLDEEQQGLLRGGVAHSFKAQPRQLRWTLCFALLLACALALALAFLFSPARFTSALATSYHNATTTSEAATPSLSAPSTNSGPFTLHFHSEPSLNRGAPLLPPECPIEVQYIDDEVQAEAVVWNSDNHETVSEAERQRLLRDRPWQKQVIWGSESASNRQGLEDYFDGIAAGKAGTDLLYDADMTYRLNGSVPGTYAYGYMNFSASPVAYEDRRSDRIAAAFVTNCHPKNARTLILDELMRLLPDEIDSFGSCRSNANAQEVLESMGHWDQVGSGSRWNIKITTISFYKFTIAIENSNELDYCTEKFYQPLERGTVPIVFGPPSVRSRFLPSPNSAIVVSDYVSADLSRLSRSGGDPPASLSDEDKEGLARMAERLKFVASLEGREEYEEMLSWKRDDTWKEASPLGKIVKLGQGLHRDCRLAGVLRGHEWAQNVWSESSV